MDYIDAEQEAEKGKKQEHSPAEQIRTVYKTLKEKKPAGRIEIAEIHTAIPRFDQYLQGSRVNRRALLELDFLVRRLLQMTERDQEIMEA